MRKLTLLFILLTFFVVVYAPVLTLEKIETDPFSDPAHLYKVVEEQSGINIPDRVEYYHLWLMYSKAYELNIPVRILFRLIQQESGYNPKARSKKGAFGYCQVMPKTYIYMLKKLDYPLNTPHTPEINIIIGTEYLAFLRHYWTDRGISGDKLWVYVLASYNAGKSNVIRYKGVPPFKETINYVKFITNET
jgi:soluble lytic murein transglycosylase-like protein